MNNTFRETLEKELKDLLVAAKNRIEELSSLVPVVKKSKNEVPTVIEWRGKRYVLDMRTQK